MRATLFVLLLVGCAHAAWKPGETVTARGKISTVPWAHVMGSVEGKKAEYFDLEGKSEQTVVYWKDAPSCAGTVEVTGKLFEVTAPQGSKAEGVRELHIDVDSATCVP